MSIFSSIKHLDPYGRLTGSFYQLNLNARITGPWKFKSWSKSSLGVQQAAIKKQKLGIWYWLVLSRSFGWEIFGAKVTSSWRHSFRAIWPGQRKSCVRDVTCQSLPSIAEGMPAFQDAVWQSVESRRAAGKYSRLAEVEIGSDSSDRSFDHFKGKNGQNLQVRFLLSRS